MIGSSILYAILTSLFNWVLLAWHLPVDDPLHSAGVTRKVNRNKASIFELARQNEGRHTDHEFETFSEDRATKTIAATPEESRPSSPPVSSEDHTADNTGVSGNEAFADEAVGCALDPRSECGDKEGNDDGGSMDESDSNDDEWDHAIINLEALRIAVASLLPGEECIEAEPFACGGYHAVARLTLRSGRVMLARVTCEWDFDDFPPYPAFKERSEMATLQYLRTHTTIPVPEAYAYSDDEDNAVGGKFTLQELLPGEALATAWDDLSDSARKAVFEQIADIRLQLFHLGFDAIGSLSAAQTSDGQRLFSVGPIVDMRVDYFGLVAPPPEPGPWSLAREWLATLVRGGLDYQFRNPRESLRYNNRAWVAHMIEVVRRLDNGVPDDGDLAICGMRHFDFDLQNILVEVTPDGSSAKITGVIDWDGAQLLPRWALAAPFRFRTKHSPEDEPDLCKWIDYCGELMLRDELFAKAQRDGRKARALYRLCLRFGHFQDAELDIAEFEAGIWGEDHAQWF